MSDKIENSKENFIILQKQESYKEDLIEIRMSLLAIATLLFILVKRK